MRGGGIGRRPVIIRGATSQNSRRHTVSVDLIPDLDAVYFVDVGSKASFRARRGRGRLLLALACVSLRRATSDARSSANFILRALHARTAITSRWSLRFSSARPSNIVQLVYVEEVNKHEILRRRRGRGEQERRSSSKPLWADRCLWGRPFRACANLTSEVLPSFAKILGVSRSHLCDIEQGRRSVSPEEQLASRMRSTRVKLSL